MVLTTLAGCFGPKEPFVPDLVPVTGKVTYHGNPVVGAYVAFHPVGPTDVAEAAFGETNSSGQFTLKMQDYGEGAIPGEYVVTVLDPSGSVPAKYKSRDDSPLRATVEDIDQNDIPLKLDDG
jgi:hypothetical protein